MNRSILISTLFAMLSLCGCDRPATVYVPVAVAVAPVPGPPGPQGATGDQGMMGNRGAQGYQGNDGMPGQQGQQGQPGDGNTVIVVPPAAEPAK